METIQLRIETSKGFVRHESPTFDIKGDFTQNSDFMKHLNAYVRKIKSLNEEWSENGDKTRAYLRVLTTSLSSNLPKEILHFSKLL